MRTEGLEGALLSTLLLALLMSLLIISAEAAWGQDIEWVRQFDPSDNDSDYGVVDDASGRLVKIEPNPAKGFYWAYYLYVPSSITGRANGNLYLLVQPNNTGYPSDNQSVHDEAAKNLMFGRRHFAEDLKVPLLVPTFPRLIVWGPSPYEIYTHALDRNTLLTEIDNLKRIDLQLIAMIDDVTEKFSLAGITVENKVLMMGFSAAGAFVNRFTLLHPERVRAAAIGHSGGWPISPLGEWNGVKLEYPIGVWDVKELVGKEFNIISVKSIPLYFYMGDQDTNDMWGPGSLVSELFGDTQVKRWPIAENMYKSVGCASRFVLYPGVGHTITQKMVDDVKTFFLEQIANTPPGENVQVTPTPDVSVTFSSVTTGGSTTATTSSAGPPPTIAHKIIGFAGQPIYYDITTTAAYSGPITICISYDETQVAGPEGNLRFMHKVDGWVNITTSVDTENNIICGTTTTLSIFIVVEPIWTGTGVFGLENLYAVSLDTDLWLGEGSKLVVKFYTYADSYRGENVVWSGTTPDNVSFSKTVPHPLGQGTQKAKLDLTTDDTDNVISTIASFTVRRVTLETRLMDIPMEHASTPPEGRMELETEFLEIPFYWSGAPD